MSDQLPEDLPFTAVQLRDFIALFDGRQSAYGQYLLEPKGKDGEKRGGKASTVSAPVTEDLFVRHITGKGAGIGIVPIKEDGTCSFAVIDIDIYTTAIKNNVLMLISALNAPLCIFTSKSGGLHIYAFFDDPIPAKTAISIMTRFKEILGLSKDIEVFPKQAKLEPGQVGNWINLPYYEAGPNCKRNLLDSDGNEITHLDGAIRYCLGMKQPLRSFDTFFEQLPLQDAPPCLQRIYLSGDIQHRNDYLLSLAHYFKAKYGDQFEEHVLEANQKLKVPLPAREVLSTVIASSRKQDYKYSCSKDPLKMFCNRKECEKRTFGISSKDISTLSFGEFRQIMTDPPYYEWLVDGVVLRLNNEDEIINQSAFRKQCVRHLYVCPNRINEPAWNDIINRALSNVKLVTVELDEDASPGAMLQKNILDYIRKRSVATSREGILRGLVFPDKSPEINGHLFTVNGLIEFLTGVKQMKPHMLLEIRDKLVVLSGEPITVNLSTAQVKCWRIPFESTENLPTPDMEEKTDFLNSLGSVFT